jgi:hypothetical protein
MRGRVRQCGLPPSLTQPACESPRWGPVFVFVLAFRGVYREAVTGGCVGWTQLGVGAVKQSKDTEC